MNAQYYFEYKTLTNLRRAPLLKMYFQGKAFASKYISLSVKFTTLLETPLILRGKWWVRGVWRVKNNTVNLIRTLLLSSEKCEKNVRLKVGVIRYIRVTGVWLLVWKLNFSALRCPEKIWNTPWLRNGFRDTDKSFPGFHLPALKFSGCRG
jgi:hypothetical protein